MTPELTALALAALLQYVQFVFMAVAVNRDVGASRLAGPRDDGIEIRGIIAGRLKRAFDNHFEGLILFTIAVVVVTLGGKSSGFTEICAWLYLGARSAYVPAYVIAMPGLRPGIWFIGFLATAAMLIAALV